MAEQDKFQIDPDAKTGSKPHMDRCYLQSKLAIVVLSLITSCSSQVKMDPIPVMTISEFNCRAEWDGLEIAVDVYSDPERIKRHFGLNLLTRQIVPVQVVFQNTGRQGGFLLQPELAILLDKTYLEGPMSWREDATTLFSQKMDEAVIGTTMLISHLLALGVAAFRQDAYFDAQEIVRRMESLKFSDQPIYHSESNSGFLYFKLGDIGNLVKVAGVKFCVMNIRSREKTTVVVPIEKN